MLRAQLPEARQDVRDDSVHEEDADRDAEDRQDTGRCRRRRLPADGGTGPRDAEQHPAERDAAPRAGLRPNASKHRQQHTTDRAIESAKQHHFERATPREPRTIATRNSEPRHREATTNAKNNAARDGGRDDGSEIRSPALHYPS